MLEVVRRLALATGTLVFLLLYFWTPAELVSVRPADFAAKLVQRQFEIPGATVESYRASLMEGRTLGPQLVQGIPHPSSPAPIFFDAADPAVAALAEILRAQPVRDNLRNVFSVQNGRDYEWILHDRPRAALAPAGSVYPNRGGSWPWLAGPLLFLALPRTARRRWIRFDPVSLLLLDLLTTALAGACFAAPLVLHASAPAALDHLFTGTLYSWAAGAVVLAGLGQNILRASWSASLEDGKLLIRGLFRRRDYDLSTLSKVEYLTRENAPCGWRLHFEGISPVDLFWHNRINWEPLAQILENR